MRIFWLSITQSSSCEPIPDASGRDARHDAGADSAATFANGKTKALVHGNRVDQFDVHRYVVARHHHLHTLRQADHAGHVGGAEVELRTVVGEERRMTPA